MASRPSRRPSSDEPVLQARLLGGMHLALDDEPVRLESQRAESLIAYLLVHRRTPIRRERLAFVLWPDSTESQARTNLRHILHTVRRRFRDVEQFIEIGARDIRCRPDARFSLDVGTFETAVSAGRWQEAVEAYRGELMEGWYDEWVLEERARLAQHYVDVLARLVADLEEQGRWADAIHYCERLVRQDPLREDAYRILIRLHRSSGDRARAIHTYHVCETTLRDELGVGPSDATRAAYEALLRPGPGGRQPDPGTRGEVPLVGRVAERALLRELWAAAEKGETRLVLVTGEAGIGKSRLVRELTSWCAHHGAVTADARGYPADIAAAYGLMIDWLRADAFARHVANLDGTRAADLARIAPNLASTCADGARTEAIPESVYRRRLFETVAQVITASERPTLLVADDLHHADVESLRFIDHLLRSRPRAVMVAATARREEVDLGDQVDALVTGLVAIGLASEIHLDRLDRDETGLLAEQAAGRPHSREEIDEAFGNSEGNPLFVIESVRGGRERTSRKVQAVIGSRLAQLSDATHRLIGVAASIGRTFTASVLQAAAGLDESAVVAGLDEAWRRGLIRATRADAYDFTHDRIHDTAYGELSPPIRRHYHLHIARALASAPSHDENSGFVAAQFDAAGAVEEAIRWYERAARVSQERFASGDAIRFLDRALELVRENPDAATSSADELRLLTSLPAPLVSVDGFLSERMAEVQRRGLELASELGAEPDPPLVRSVALAMITRGDFEGARPFAEQLRARAEREGDDVLWVESQYVLGISHYWQGHLELACSAFENAIARCRVDQRDAHLLRYGHDPRAICQMRLAHVLWLLGRTDESEAARCDVFDLTKSGVQPFSRALVLIFAAILALDREADDELAALLHEIESGAPRSALTDSGLESLFGYLEVTRGHVKPGIDRVQRALAVAERQGAAAPGHHGTLERILVAACGRGDRPDVGLAAADRALLRGAGTQLWEPEIRRLRAHFLSNLGRPAAEVDAELQRALDVSRRQRSRPFGARILIMMDRLGAGTDEGTSMERLAREDAPAVERRRRSEEGAKGDGGVQRGVPDSAGQG